ncbi:hypothetical protein IGA77_13720, partial [Pseudomonas aeruginosa]|nr:hypothetical protein [Pseudomonas aeruginosa]
MKKILLLIPLAFTLAAYNMGPERVQNLRTQARRRRGDLHQPAGAAGT